MSESIGSYDVGVDPGGVPTVELVRHELGECGGENGARFWVRFDEGAISVDPAPAGSQLVWDAAIPSSTGGKYEIPTAGVTVVIDRVDESVLVEFSDATTTMSVTCSLSGEDAIACVP